MTGASASLVMSMSPPTVMFRSPTDVPDGPPGRMSLPRRTRFSGIVSLMSISTGANAPMRGSGASPARCCGGAAGGIAPVPARVSAWRVASSAPALETGAVDGATMSGRSRDRVRVVEHRQDLVDLEPRRLQLGGADDPRPAQLAGQLDVGLDCDVAELVVDQLEVARLDR